MNRRQLLLGLIGVPAAALAAKAVADDGVSLYNSPHPGWDEYTIVKEECEDLTNYGELGRKYHEALIKATNEDARIAREETLQRYFASPSGLWLPR